MILNFCILVIFTVGVILITQEFVKRTFVCPPSRVEYKYIPRTMEEEAQEPAYVSEIFKPMFNDPSPWVRSISTYDVEKTEQLNKYFASQS